MIRAKKGRGFRLSEYARLRKMKKKIELLRNIHLFKNLSPFDLERIGEITYEKVFEKEEVIFKEGEIGDAFYLVTKGSVRISTYVPNVGEEALAILKEGDYFGEMALIDDAPRSANAIAHEGKANLLAIYKIDFKKLLSDDKELAYKLLWVFIRTLTSRLRETDEKLKGVYALAKSF